MNTVLLELIAAREHMLSAKRAYSRRCTEKGVTAMQTPLGKAMQQTDDTLGALCEQLAAVACVRD